MLQPSSGSMTRRKVSRDRKSTRLNSSHLVISYAVFCLKKESLVAHAEDQLPEVLPAVEPQDRGRKRLHPVHQVLDGFFFFNDTPTPEIYSLPLHAVLPI